VVLLYLFLSDASGLIFWQPPTLFLAPVLFQQTRGHASQGSEGQGDRGRKSDIFYRFPDQRARIEYNYSKLGYSAHLGILIEVL
jgi:hypothetical protein